MHFNVVVTNNGIEEQIAIINAQETPNKGEEIEIVRNKISEKFKVIGVERKYVNRVNNVWDSFITVNVVRYE